MPKLRMTDQQRREKALMRALEKAKFENDLKSVSYTHLTLPTICSV